MVLKRIDYERCGVNLCKCKKFIPEDDFYDMNKDWTKHKQKEKKGCGKRFCDYRAKCYGCRVCKKGKLCPSCSSPKGDENQSPQVLNSEKKLDPYPGDNSSGGSNALYHSPSGDNSLSDDWLERDAERYYNER